MTRPISEREDLQMLNAKWKVNFFHLSSISACFCSAFGISYLTPILSRNIGVLLMQITKENRFSLFAPNVYLLVTHYFLTISEKVLFTFRCGTLLSMQIISTSHMKYIIPSSTSLIHHNNRKPPIHFHCIYHMNYSRRHVTFENANK